MTGKIIILCVLFWGQCIYAQQTDCKVNLPSISGTYSGGCRKGLAQGKGVATGTDRYEGQFRNGLPDGRGTYTWADGTVYSGQWLNGVREGRGKMIYITAKGDSVITGYWKNNLYAGIQLVTPYNIKSNIGVSRYLFNQINDKGSEVTIKLYLGSMVNSDVTSFSVASDSGDEFQQGTITGIEHARFPLDIILKYRTWNQLRTAQHNVIFEFTITDPGKWEVIVTNY